MFSQTDIVNHKIENMCALKRGGYKQLENHETYTSYLNSNRQNCISLIAKTCLPVTFKFLLMRSQLVD